MPKKAKALLNSRMMKKINLNRSYKTICGKIWEDCLSSFNEYKLTNPHGQVRTIKENRQLMLVLKLCLEFELQKVKAGELLAHKVNMTEIKRHCVITMYCRHRHVRCLCQALFEYGDLSSYIDYNQPKSDDSNGNGNDNFNNDDNESINTNNNNMFLTCGTD
jgi:hypothetical protein